VKEQDYSLNPGRYVGVVIEEDGKTEEEFLSDLVALVDELDELEKEASKTYSSLMFNAKKLLGEQ